MSENLQRESEPNVQTSSADSGAGAFLQIMGTTTVEPYLLTTGEGWNVDGAVTRELCLSAQLFTTTNQSKILITADEFMICRLTTAPSYFTHQKTPLILELRSN